MAALEAIKSQFKALEELKATNTTLRERKVEQEQKLESSKERIKKLEEDLTDKSNAEAALKKKIDELQSSKASLESEKASAEASKARLLVLTTSESNLRQDLEKLKSEKIENLTAIALIIEQKATLEREKGDLHVSCESRASVNSLNSQSESDQRNHQDARRCASYSSRLQPGKGQNESRSKHLLVVRGMMGPLTISRPRNSSTRF